MQTRQNINTLRDFVHAIPGDLVLTDRGNGSAGPACLDLTDLDLDEDVTLVTETSDPDAWARAREALSALLSGDGHEPSLVAVGDREDGHNGYQAIYVG